MEPATPVKGMGFTIDEALTLTGRKRKSAQSRIPSPPTKPPESTLKQHNWSFFKVVGRIVGSVGATLGDYSDWIEKLDEEYQDGEELRSKPKPTNLRFEKTKKYKELVENYLTKLGIDKQLQTAILVSFIAGFAIAMLGMAFAFKAAILIGGFLFLSSFVGAGAKYKLQSEKLAASAESENLHRFIQEVGN